MRLWFGEPGYCFLQAGAVRLLWHFFSLRLLASSMILPVPPTEITFASISNIIHFFRTDCQHFRLCFHVKCWKCNLLLCCCYRYLPDHKSYRHMHDWVQAMVRKRDQTRHLNSNFLSGSTVIPWIWFIQVVFLRLLPSKFLLYWSNQGWFTVLFKWSLHPHYLDCSADVSIL
jgi:hypothetical protein